MATRNDFEKKQRERLRQARIRQKRNKTILTAAAAVLVIIIAIVSMVSCNSKKKNNQEIVPENVNNNLTTTPAPDAEAAATAAPEASATPMPTDVPADNDLLKIIDESSAKKYAYLTFDDGPTESITPKVLDVLRRYNVKATFFQVGSYVKTLPDMTKRVHEEGHLIATHSYSHNYEKLYETEESFKTEVQDSYDLICEVIGEKPLKLFRFPGGSYSTGDHGTEKQKYKGTLNEMGFYYVDWNALNGDAEGKTKNASGLVEYFKKNIPDDEENLVILMHDSSTKQATVDALDDIIDYLISEGYSFHRLDEIPDFKVEE